MKTTTFLLITFFFAVLTSALTPAAGTTETSTVYTTLTVTVRKSDSVTLGTFTPAPTPLPASTEEDKAAGQAKDTPLVEAPLPTTSTTITSTSTRLTTVTSELPSKSWTTETITSCTKAHISSPTESSSDEEGAEEGEGCDDLPAEESEVTKSAAIPVLTLISTTRLPRGSNSTTTFAPQKPSSVPIDVVNNGTKVQYSAPTPTTKASVVTNTVVMESPAFEGADSGTGKVGIIGGVWGVMGLGLLVVGTVMGGL